jgi:hypothetical protein
MKDLNKAKNLIKVVDEIKKRHGVINGIVPADKFDSYTREIEFVLKHERLHSESPVRVAITIPAAKWKPSTRNEK